MNSPQIAEQILVGASLILASAIVGLAKVQVRNQVSAQMPMGSPAWDFSRSWASNFTVAGGLVAAALPVLAAVPKGPSDILPRQAYLVFGLLFALLAALAPLVYNVLRHVQADPSALDGSGLRYDGSVRGFLAASVVTMWAVCGQFMLLIAMFQDLASVRAISWPLARLFQLFFVVIALGFLPHAVRTLRLTMMVQTAGLRPSTIPPTTLGVPDAEKGRTRSIEAWPLL